MIQVYKVGGKMFKGAIIVLSIVTALVHAESKSALVGMAGVNLKCSQDLKLTARYSQIQNHYHNQVEDLSYPGFLPKTKGTSSQEGAVGMLVSIGSIGKIDISWGGEISIKKAYAVDSLRGVPNNEDPSKYDSIPFGDLFEYRPTGLINFSMPIIGSFSAHYNAKLERRIIRKPGSLTHLRYVGQTRLSMNDDFLSIPMGASLFYEGSIQERSDNLAQWGAEIRIEPIKNLEVEAGYSAFWKPGVSSSNIFPVYFGISYTFDISQ